MKVRLAFLICATMHAAPLGAATIVGGEAVDPKLFPGIVRTFHEGGMACTGSLVGPRTVVTAAHCGKLTEVEFLGNRYPTSAYGVADGQGCDMAAGNLAAPIPGARPFFVSARVRIGQRVRMLGYGCTDFGDPRPSNVLYQAFNRIRAVTFRNIYLGSPDEKGVVCQGDAGGPTLAEIEPGLTELVGIHSQSDLESESLDTKMSRPAIEVLLRDRTLEKGVFVCGLNSLCLNPLDPQPVTMVTEWNLVGPFPYNRNKDISTQPLAPEQGPLDLGVTYPGKDGKTVAWKKVSPSTDGFVDIRKQMNESDAIAYLAAFVNSPRSQAIRMLLQSDDSAELWLNGQKLLSENASRAVDHFPTLVTGQLSAGRNVLLFKIANGDGDWAGRIVYEAGELR